MTKKEKIVSILSVLIIGAISGHHIDDIIEKYNFEVDRYPLAIEYQIMENCISNYATPLPINLVKIKKDICVCAFEKTELAYAYDKYILDKDMFLTIFEEKANECLIRYEG